MLPRFRTSLISAALAGCLVAVPSVARAASFTFETVPLGTATPFSLTDGGLTATFSSPDGAVFTITSVSLNTLSGHALFDNDPPLHELDIVFSAPINNFLMDFALNGPSGSTMTAKFYIGGLGGSLLATLTNPGAIPPGFVVPEGVIGVIGGLTFDTVRLTASVQDFAIDNITVNTSPVPEPASLTLVGLGLAGLVQRLRRARAR